MKLFLLLALAFAFVASIYCFSVHENAFEKHENSTIIENFKIEAIKKNPKDDFPKQIKTVLNVLGLSHDISLERVHKRSTRHPISSRSVYRYDVENDRFARDTRFDEEEEELDHAFYHDKNNSCSATVIKNPDKSIKMIGSCLFDGHEYHIIPVRLDAKRKKRDTVNSNPHGIIKRQVNPKGYPIDYTLIDPERAKNPIPFYKRLNNKAPALYTVVELLIAVDFSTFLDHKKSTGIQDEKMLIKYIRIYMAQLINMVNMMYLNSFNNDADLKMSVKIKNFIIATESRESVWTNRDQVGVSGQEKYNDKEVVQSDKTLRALSEFVTAKKLSFKFDHCAGISNKDFWSDNENQSPKERSMNCGLAYVGRACKDEYKYSINEDNGFFNGAGTVAHELGHNLGANHDGSSDFYTNCPASVGNIMTPISSKGPESFKFSSCSIQAIKNYVLKDGAVSSDASCLTDTDSDLISEHNLGKTTYPGQFFTPEDQCKSAYDKYASFCQRLKDKLCVNLWCKQNPKTTVCSSTSAAAYGTTCGSGKMCINGECVENENAPKGDCLYGDEDQIKFYSNYPTSSCENFLEDSIKKETSNFCSVSKIADRCCRTCKIYTKLNCFDKYSNCETDWKSSCSQDEAKANCPKTCGVCQQKLKCENVDNPCSNGGICRNIETDKVKSFVCDCKEGFSGTYCDDKDPCVPNRCPDGKTCTRMGSKGYFCDYTI